MKASELNGTHLGQRVTITEGGCSATGQLSRVDHSGQIITDRPAMLIEQEVLGRLWVNLEFLGAMHATVTPAADVTVHTPGLTRPNTGHPDDDSPGLPKPRPHRLTENHNADPVCTCGWDPAWLLLGINDRETAREAVRDHILERGGQ